MNTGSLPMRLLLLAYAWNSLAGQTPAAHVGRPAEVLNNLGYHYLLQGKVEKARETLLAAQAKDPLSPEIKNNLIMVDTWKSSDAAGAISPTVATGFLRS